MDDRQAFARWMKRLRAELNMTQAAVAAEAGCALQTVRAFEIGRRRPSPVVAELLANVLKVSSSERAAFIRLATGSAGVQADESPRDTAGRIAAPAPASSLIMTKLYRPHVPKGVVERPRLHEKIRAGVTGPLTLVAAPAGFGKTTLVAHELAALPHANSWLSLDADDNDPATFVHYVVTAMQSVSTAVSPATSILAQAGVSRPDTALHALINDLATLPHELILTLDDYHLITNPAIHTAMALLLDHMPPRLHLVILTRADPPFPLAKLRVRRQLVEIRAADLRFTLAEATTFLHEQIGHALTPADMAVLDQHTEGWIAGLHLAALSLQQLGTTHTSDFVAAFNGSNRFVVDYLVDEVIGQLPGHIQTFVLSTSILERLCAPLCDAVVGIASIDTNGNDSSYSQLILAELERLNLFLVPLDDQRRWYRYHHLFADVVQQRLVSGASAADVIALHERASNWFEGHGLIREAVHHAIAGAAWSHAVRLIEQHGLVLLLRGHVHTVLNWLQVLPVVQMETHPFLQVIHGAALLFTNQLASAEARLQAVEDAVADARDDQRSRLVRGTATFVRANLARFRGDVPRFVTLTRTALDLLPAAAKLQRDVAQLSLLASDHVIVGDVTTTSERKFLDALAAVAEAGDLSALLRGKVVFAGLQRLQGRLRQAAATYSAVADMLSDPRIVAGLVDSAAYYVGLGDLLREWNDLDAAERYLTEGRNVARGTMITSADSITLGYIALARVTAARGDREGAVALLDEWQHLAAERSFANDVMNRGRTARARLALLHGDYDSARTWAAASGLQLDDEVVFLHEYEYLTLVRVAIADGHGDVGSGRLSAALRLLGRWHDAATTRERWSTVLETLILQALALAALGDQPTALHTVKRAVELARPEGYIRLFVDEGELMYPLLRKLKASGIGPVHYLDTLLAAFHVLDESRAAVDSRSTREPPLASAHVAPVLVEPLTDREQEVLQLLAAGASNQAIADRLVISIATTKKHINNIFGKLHTRSRTEAVARARDLHLLP